MPLDPVIRGTPSDVIWGTNGVYSGRVLSARRRRQTEKDLSLDNNGVPTGSVTLPGLTEYELEIEVLNSTALPSVGDLITIADDANCIVDSVEEMWERKGRKKARISAHKFPS